MGSRKPGMLLILYILLPVKTDSIGQILLCQVRALQAARIVEQNFDLDRENNPNKLLKNVLKSLFIDPFNTPARAYLELLAPQLGLFDYAINKIRQKIANNKFEFSNLALTNSIVDRIQIQEIKEVIANGRIVKEYFDGKYRSGYSIEGSTQADRQIRIKCGKYTRSQIRIVSLSEIDIELEENLYITEENTDNE
ncbi:DUF4258 domain-containing protein [Chamaesiphon polymorphus]|uniref:Uncharacterized protein n=1 Tax=Chamaesiphon polymorphus CCALA 037 TaxID=2107692 RepID=A0A2T1FAB2_9CYAN|nr:DUF4258 domain-containing protein [Chamaesiphon polymorphus]PSB41952.1 hypothetical protein C7B77_27015 [Chamaesiphon polymorphus CCALA 037]